MGESVQGGTKFHFPPKMSLGKAMILLFLAAAAFGAIPVMKGMELPNPFLLGAGIVGGILVFVTVVMSTGAATIHILDGIVTVQHAILGIPRSKIIKCDEVDRVLVTSPQWGMAQESSHKNFYIELLLKGGEQVEIRSAMSDYARAQAIAAAVEREIIA